MPSLEGPVSWRKPITFGLSTGILSLSIAWILGLRPQTNWLVRQAAWFAGLLIAEVTLIDIQQWRGVPSHFYNATPLDGAIFTTMGLLITTVSGIIVVWTRALFRHSLPTTAAYAFAARAGMVMLNVGNLIGIIIAATQMTHLKPIHGAALHVIQLLPAMVWVVDRMRYSRHVAVSKSPIPNAWNA